MAMQINLDHIETLELEESSGVIQGVKRLARVTGVRNTVNNDWNVIREVLEHPDMPKYGDFLPPDLFEYRHLILVKRSAKVADDPGTIDVALTYDHVLNGPYQDLTGGPGRLPIYGRMRSSVSEEETNKEPVDLVRMPGHTNPHPHLTAGYRAAIVAYQYRPNSNNANRAAPELQVGTFKAVFPESTYSLSGWLDVHNPQEVENYYLAKVNNHTWLDKPPETWLCTEVQYQLMASRSPLVANIHRYQFSLEFQYRSDGWQPGIVFIDKDTNRPPSDVNESPAVPVEGYYGNISASRRIYFYTKVDFRGPPGQVDKGYLGVAEAITE